jgi:hypothetical protein
MSLRKWEDFDGYSVKEDCIILHSKFPEILTGRLEVEKIISRYFKI